MGISFAEAITNLEEISRLAKNRIDPDLLNKIDEFLAYSSQRRQHGVDHTVVAFAGGTGTGKSSLFNSVVGSEIAQVAPTRPTTSEAQAVCSAPATEILDWLDVQRRHIEPKLTQTLELSSQNTRASVIMLDFPDIDSTNDRNRAIARRLSEKVDVLIWVLDPQKYADAIVHDDYLAHMRHHAEVTIVVLNQADTLPEEIQAAVVADAHRLLKTHGIDIPVLATSAIAGMGISQLRARISSIVSRRNAAYVHLCAQLKNIAQALTTGTNIGDLESLTRREPSPDDELTGALLGAIGGKHIAKMVYDSAIYRGKNRTTSLVTRWLWRAKIDPLKRYRVGSETTKKVSKEDPSKGLGEFLTITDLIGVDPTYEARYEMLLDRVLDRYINQMPKPWAHDVTQRNRPRAMALLSTVARALHNLSLPISKIPLCWRAINVLQWLCASSAIIGGLWLLLLNFGYLVQIQLVSPPAVNIGGVVAIGVPLILILGAILGSLLVSGVGSVANRWRARRLQRAVMRDLERRISKELVAELFVPLTADALAYVQYVRLVESLQNVKA